jgi:two-component sensor histidine kinase
VPCARLRTRHVLREWGLVSQAENTALIVTELVTNAVRASAVLGAPAFRLWLASDLTRVLIVVWDASPQPPVRAETSIKAEYGRGLSLVEAVSENWGWYCRKDTAGKFVWALL